MYTIRHNYFITNTVVLDFINKVYFFLQTANSTATRGVHTKCLMTVLGKLLEVTKHYCS